MLEHEARSAGRQGDAAVEDDLMGFGSDPARLASTRLPGKPLADIDGLPMVVRVAQRAARSPAPSR